MVRGFASRSLGEGWGLRGFRKAEDEAIHVDNLKA